MPASIGRDDREALAYLRSIFEGSIDFAMGQVPMEPGGVGIHIAVLGQPRRAVIVVSHRGEHRNLASGETHRSKT